MKKKVCPDCGSQSFIVSAIEYHEWVVDSDGGFLTDLGCDRGEVRSLSEWACNGCCAVYSSNEELKEVEE